MNLIEIRHTKVSNFEQCPYKFNLEYVQNLDTIDIPEPSCPLAVGTLIHESVEIGFEKALQNYLKKYPIINDQHITEIMKIEYFYPKLMELLPEGENEVRINYKNFGGIIDLLVPTEIKDVFDIYDFKYSNNIDNYLKSKQLHLYKHFYELQTGNKIRNMYYVFIPKTFLRQKYKNKSNKIDETLYFYRKRLMEDLSQKSIQIIQIEFDYNKVTEFLLSSVNMAYEKKFEKNPSRLCDWCKFQDFCEKGESFMLLPKNERIIVPNSETKKKIWIYGLPFSGKSYLANSFPSPLFLSTDGNYTQLPNGVPPHIDIKDKVKVEGRITKRTYAWQILKDVILELEKKENDFKTIIIDLVEDTYEFCRVFMYNELNITHESDDSFRAWDKVRVEFLSTIRRLMSLDYENIILISHEDSTKDITKKSGDKITSIKPNLNDKVSLKLAGMVDIVGRVLADDSKRVLSFKNNEVIFGGGRLSTKVTEISCSYEEIQKIYNINSKPIEKSIEKSIEKPIEKSIEEPIQEPSEKPIEVETSETPVRKRRPRV